MKHTLSSCYVDASAALIGVGSLLQRESDIQRNAVLKEAQRSLEDAQQILGRLVEEEPMPTTLDVFRRILGMQNVGHRRPTQAVADSVQVAKPVSDLPEHTEPAHRTAAAGHSR